ncbi:MAG: hypothetical protein WEB33_08580 [Bacteroidota bacterium]
MRPYKPFLLFLFVVPSILSAEVFKGEPTRVQGSAMVIRWETADEAGIREFVVVCREIRSGGAGQWRDVGRKDATGTSTVYTMEDTDIFKSADRMLEYEIRAIATDGRVVESVPLKTLFPSGLTSAARRTWGSIKAMFR